MKCIFALIYICTTTSVTHVLGLSLTVRVPPFPKVGQDVTLEADIDLGGDTLQYVKWFKDNVQFYTVTPQGTQTKPAPGVVVDTANSSQGKVILQKVTAKSSGMYKCELWASGRMIMRGSGMAVF